MNEYVVTGHIFCVVMADSKEDAIVRSRNKENWEDYDWYEQDAELYQEASDAGTD